MSEMTPCALAYVAEYGTLPVTRYEQDRYSAFRFGYEAGRRAGAQVALRTAAHNLTIAAEQT